jgi:hypothetical protein
MSSENHAGIHQYYARDAVDAEVFISYRGVDAGGYSALLYVELCRQFGAP